MATFDSIFILESGDAANLTVNAGASTAATLLGTNQLFAIIGSGDFHIRFGDSDQMGAASANSMRVPSDSWARFDMGGVHTHIRIFNPGAAAIKIQYIPLSRS